MSNIERTPGEVACLSRPGPHGEVLDAREVPLGGPRAMTVRRTLPQRRRSLVGAWCFVDHYGPDDTAMRVPGHPHTGLQTVSWLFRGEIEHRDTTGAHAMVRPGELDLMTAGRGIAHSEFSTADAGVLHGAQLWIALPEAARSVVPAFESYVPPRRDLDGTQLRVFLGALDGERSPATTYSPLLGAELVVPAGGTARVPVEPDFEHAVLVDTGVVSAGGHRTAGGQLAYLAPGPSDLEITAEDGEPARVLLLGGEPLDEQIVMWWNFVGRDHDEIVDFRERWEDQRDGADGGFGPFPPSWTSTLPAPELPGTRLKPRH